MIEPRVFAPQHEDIAGNSYLDKIPVYEAGPPITGRMKWMLAGVSLLSWPFFGTIVAPLTIFLLGFVLLELAKHYQQKQRISYLRAKYAGQDVLDLILERRVWLGQTAEQLVDSVGRPHGVDHKMLKTIRREVWKYGHRGSKRYRLRVTLDFGRVVSWDDKS